MEKKKITTKSIARKNAIREEIYEILRHESHKVFAANMQREDNLTKRLSSVETAGIPQNELEFIKTAVSQIRYKQHQQQRAMEGLLQFFNITKNFFEEPKP